MRGRNHDSKLALILKSTAVLVVSVSSNADNHTVMVLIYLVNTNANIFYLTLQPRCQLTSCSQKGRVSMANRVWPVMIAAINSASPPS